MKDKKTIVFTPSTEGASVLQSYPKPSKKYLPDWYKQLPPYANSDTKLKFRLEDRVPNLTIKRCIPFLDAMTSGYMLVLEEDVYVEEIDGKSLMRWRSPDTLITLHSQSEFTNFPIPDTHHYMIAKWVNNWVIEVPKNYTLLFSHPSNRFDLPFLTFSGLVNGDTWVNLVHFPFILKKGFEGIIESGTPICQINIIKNEEWNSKVTEVDLKKDYKNLKKFYQTFAASYKKTYWKKHNYN